jgi:hypothetical protein
LLWARIRRHKVVESTLAYYGVFRRVLLHKHLAMGTDLHLAMSQSHRSVQGSWLDGRVQRRLWASSSAIVAESEERYGCNRRIRLNRYR